MEIKLTNARSILRKRLLLLIMRTFIFLLCATAFGFNPSTTFSQKKVQIGKDQVVSVDQVFEIIKAQSDFKFIYPTGLFKDAPKVTLKKGEILLSDLLEKSLSYNGYIFELSEKNTLMIKSVNTVNKKQKQGIKITGTVKDESGISLPGVTVLVKNSNRGASTDIDGKFEINVANREAVLIFMSLGFETKEVTVGNDTNINVVLNVAVGKLDEIVVVGYGSTKKADLTGSVGSIKADEIKQIKTQTLDENLVGRVSGVFVSSQSGGPGSGAIVHIRGLSQLDGDNQPLYVIDGVPIVINQKFGAAFGVGTLGDRENPLLNINPADIERIDILKDASSAAIYGSRAANGVVIVTTKRGRRNRKPSLSFSYNTTLQTVLNKYDVLNTNQFKEFITDQGLDGSITFGDADTDWQDKITNKVALWNQYDVSVSGGTENVNYLISGRVSDQEGLLLGTELKRYTFSASVDADITENLKVGANSTYNYSVNNQSGINTLSTGAFFRPDLPVFNDDGTYSTSLDFFNFEVKNPLGGQGKANRKGKAQNLLGSLYAEYELIDHLKLKSQLSVNVSNDRSSSFEPSHTFNGQIQKFFGREGSLLDVFHTFSTSTSWSNTLNFNKTFNEIHTITAVAGVSWDRSRTDVESQSYDGFPDDEILVNINSANNFSAANSDANETALNSLFGRFNYNYDNRYLATFTARYDGSIKFGPDNRRGFFPSGALAWNMHNEEFLKNNGTLSQLKLRASLGRTGSDNLPAFTYLANYQPLDNGDSFYDGVNGISVNGVPNSSIKWETTDQLDLGVEFGLFNNRLQGEVVYFEKNTSDIILLTPIPAQTGFSRWNSNVADVSNKGWEVTLSGDIIRNNNFKWNSSLNISFIKNKLESLNGGSTVSFNDGLIEGQPMGVIFGYDVVSIAQTQEEIDALNMDAPSGSYHSRLTEPGDYIYRDVNGDNQINGLDRVVLGDITPNYFGGWNNSFSYKNFDFALNFNFVQGNKREWVRGANEFANINPNKNVTTAVYDTWTPDNTDAKYARLGSRTHGVFPPTSKNVEDGSYIKLRAASIGYSFSQNILDKLNVKKLGLTFSANNLFIITNYPGIDPESVNAQRGGATTDLKSDGGFAYPQARTFTIGLNVSL